MEYEYQVQTFYFDDAKANSWAREFKARKDVTIVQTLTDWLNIWCKSKDAVVVSITETGDRLTAIVRCDGDDDEEE